MPHTPHEISAEFPQDAEILHTLKLEDAHFRNLSEKYHEVNREIHRIEVEVEAASDDRAEQLKKERLALIDAIGGIISKAKQSA